MTGRDLMPFGKYAKMTPPWTLAQVKADKAYVAWLCEQEWMKTPKNQQLYDFFTQGESVTSTPKEVQTIETEREILAGASPEFKAFWFRSYGERLRKMGEINYIAYLRVALQTWESCCEEFGIDETPRGDMHHPPVDEPQEPEEVDEPDKPTDEF